VDRSQFVEQVAAIDLEISVLRGRIRPMEFSLARGGLAESDRAEYARLREDVGRLAEQKARLRNEFAKI
jgi:hypothetical protein